MLLVLLMPGSLSTVDADQKQPMHPILSHTIEWTLILPEFSISTLHAAVCSLLPGLQCYQPLDKAVISSCLHAFCSSCLAAWCERKRACPVCRGSVSSYYHSIHSDEDFKEHIFPPAPAAAAGGSFAQYLQQQRWSTAEALLSLQEDAARLAAAVQQFTNRTLPGLQHEQQEQQPQHQQQQQQQQQQSRTLVVDELDGGWEVEQAGRSRRLPRVQLVQERFTTW